MEKRQEIFSFKQQDRETLYDAWERFKLLLKKSLALKFHEMDTTQLFTNGVKPTTRTILDALAGGTMKNKKCLRIPRADREHVL